MTSGTDEIDKRNAREMLRNEEEIEGIETHPDTKSSGKHHLPRIF